jgi:hypothetical protein
VDGQTVRVPTLIDDLRSAGNLRLLHFSACLLLQDPAVVSQFQKFSDETRTAVSGYTTSVNWAAGAIIEFTYLELVLSQGRPPAEAVGQLMKLLPFAGNEGVPDGAFPAAGFRIVTPEPAGVPSRVQTRHCGARAGRRRRPAPAARFA